MSKEELTKEKILDMKPWELDRYIHELLFDGEDLSEFECRGSSYVKVTDTKVTWRDVRKYSTDMTTAWEVAELYPIAKVERVEIFVGNIEVMVTLWEGFDHINPIEVTAKTAPEAICKAALLAVIGGSENE